MNISFENAARTLTCDECEGRFDAADGEIVQPKPKPNPPPKRPKS